MSASPLQAALTERRVSALALITSTLAVLWLGIVLALILRRMPYIDEGLYTLAPHNWITTGSWGSPEVEPSRHLYPGFEQPQTRIDRRTYWILPLTTHLEAAWFWLFGWGLIQQRLISTVMGIAGVVVWFQLVRRWTGDVVLARLATLLIAFDWGYLGAASGGRMEMLGNTLGLMALYTHERFFSSRPLLARCLAGAFLSATAMVHPNAFVVWCAVYGFRSVVQWRQFKIAQAGAFLAPALVTALLFGVWISYDFQAFADQMRAHSAVRLAAVHPSEVRRYLDMYGLLPQPSWRSIPKAAPLITFVMAVGILLLKKGSLRLPGLREVIGIAVVAAIALALVDRTKWGWYGIYVAPWICIIAAYGLRSVWQGAGRVLGMAWLATYVLLSLLAGIMVAQRDSMGNIYVPAVAALQNLGVSNAMVFAPPEFRFAYEGPFLFDVRYGFVSRRSVRAIAVSKDNLQDSIDSALNHNPEFAAHLRTLFGSACSNTYENEKYAVYSCR